MVQRGGAIGSMSIKKRYYAPTPEKWQKIGDTVLGLSLALQPLTLTLPISDNTRLWINFGFAAVGVVSKFLTNLASE